MTLDQAIQAIQSKDKAASEHAKKLAQARWDHIAKPLHSLGLLEEAIIAIEGVSPDITLKKRCVVVMCADNGIVEEGVTQTGSEVTAVVAENILHQKASINKMSQIAHADVIPVDIGMLTDIEGMITRKTMYGTKNFRKEPAMSKEAVVAAIETGISMVEQLKKDGYTIIGTGEMGIGNTTTSSAIASVLLERPVSEMTGKGAGLSKEGVQHKAKVIEEAIAFHHLTKEEPLRVLQTVGGLDIAGMTGLFLGGAVYGVPIIIDGFISSVAALTASKMCKESTDAMLASHVSQEPAAKLVLEALNKKPMLCCEMSLGEGTGAVAILPLLDMAMNEYQSMPTFHEIEIKEYQPL